MSALNGMPRDGKIVVLAPQQAAMVAEAAPKHAERVWTSTHLHPNKALVIDLDQLFDGLPDWVRRSPGST